VSFAPFCQPDTLQIAAPAVRETAKDCIKKHPFTTVSIPLAATFESLSPDMRCTIAKTQDKDVLVTCTGQELFSYQLKICNPKPVITVSGAGQCPEGADYVQVNQCCVRPAAADAGCTTFQIDLKSCTQTE
jgi:hypothetical protein